MIKRLSNLYLYEDRLNHIILMILFELEIINPFIMGKLIFLLMIVISIIFICLNVCLRFTILLEYPLLIKRSLVESIQMLLLLRFFNYIELLYTHIVQGLRNLHGLICHMRLGLAKNKETSKIYDFLWHEYYQRMDLIHHNRY